MRIDPKRQARRVRGTDAGGWTSLPPLARRRGAIGQLLGTRGSLTAALRRHGATTVTVLRQRLARAHRDEVGLLDPRPHARLMVREVLLRVNGEPWVFAHTLANVPAQRLLRRAGRRPLATVLFTDPKVSAGGLYYRALPFDHALVRKAAVLSSPKGISFGPPTSAARLKLPARRALFVRGAARLVVTEVFLAAALAG